MFAFYYFLGFLALEVPNVQFALEVGGDPFLEKFQIPDLILKFLAVFCGVYWLLEGIVVIGIPETYRKVFEDCT